MTITEIIDSVATGSLDPAAAGDQIRKIIVGSDEEGDWRPAPEAEGYAETALQRVADKDDSGFETSFNVVTAAWIGGDLTDGQYHTIRDVVVPPKGAQSEKKQSGS